MKRLLIYSGMICWLAWSGSVPLRAQPDEFDRMAGIIRAGNAKDLVKHFHRTVELNIDGEEDSYSQARAEAVLRTFFTENPPKNFEINHRGASRSGARYAIGKYHDDDGSYRVWIKLKEVNGKNLIAEMSFIKEE